MNITSEEKCDQILSKVSELELAIKFSNMSKREFRNILVKEASAKILTDFDQAFPDMTKWETELTEFRKIGVAEQTANFIFAVLVFLGIFVAPWCYGVYKFFF